MVRTPWSRLVSRAFSNLVIRLRTGNTLGRARRPRAAVPAFPWHAEVLDARLLLSGPTANNDSYSVLHDQTFNATGARGVLNNDTPAFSGDTMTAALVAGPSHGTLTFNSNPMPTFTPSASPKTAQTYPPGMTPFSPIYSGGITSGPIPYNPEIQRMFQQGLKVQESPLKLRYLLGPNPWTQIGEQGFGGELELPSGWSFSAEWTTPQGAWGSDPLIQGGLIFVPP